MKLQYFLCSALVILGSPAVQAETGGKIYDLYSSIELSNVDAIRVMTEMIEVLRGYESYQKVIRTIDDVTSKLINEVGQFE